MIGRQNQVWTKRLRRLGVGLAMWIVSGCAKPPPPPPPPLVPSSAAAVRQTHYVGTALSGPLDLAPTALSPADALEADVRWIGFEKLPPGLLEPLSPSARLIYDGRGASPVRSSARLARLAAFAVGPAAQKFSAALASGDCGRKSLLSHGQSALFPSTTALFEAADADPTVSPTTRPAGAGHRRVAIALTRSVETDPSGADVDPSLMIEDRLPDAAAAIDASDAAASSTAPASGLQREAVVLETVHVKDPVDLAMVFPFRFRLAKNNYVAAIIHLKKPAAGKPVSPFLQNAASADIAASYAIVAGRDNAPTPDESAVASALSAMGQASSRRSAITFLAGWSGAHLCEDVALSADEPSLTALTAALVPALSKLPPQRELIGWAMDLTSLQMLVRLKSDGKLPPELDAVLADRAGEAGRRASALDEILIDLHSPVELEARLAAANRSYLEDSSPGSRARALGWLKTRNLAPSGYEPMAPARQRRAALEKAAAAATSPATPSGAAP